MIIQKKLVQKSFHFMSLINISKANILLDYSHYKFKNNKNKPLLVHHGLMGNQRNFKSLVHNSLISQHRNSFLIDCRNHGKSPKHNSHTIPDLAQDLDQFIKKQIIDKYPNEKITLMGHSMGAKAIMSLTVLKPQLQQHIDQIIIIDMSCTPKGASSEVKQNWKKTGEMIKNMSKIQMHGKKTHDIYADIQKVAISKDVAGLFKSDIKILGQNKHQWTTNMEVIVKYYQNISLYDAISEKKSKKDKIDWQKPVNIIYGSKSNYIKDIDLQNFKQLYPNLDLNKNVYKVEGAGHWVHFDKPMQFLGIVNKILKQQK